MINVRRTNSKPISFNGYWVTFTILYILHFYLHWSPEKLWALSSWKCVEIIMYHHRKESSLPCLVSCNCICVARYHFLKNVSFLLPAIPIRAVAPKSIRVGVLFYLLPYSTIVLFCNVFCALNTGKSGNYFYCSNDSLDSRALSSQSV